MSLEEIPFEEQLIGVRLEGELERAELKGVEKNRIDFISKALKHMSPEEVSNMFELPIEYVNKVANSYSK